MVSRTGQVLLVGIAPPLAVLVATAAETAHCQLTPVTGLAQAGKLVAKKQFDLILIDSAALGREDLDRLLKLDLTNQGRIVLAGGATPAGPGCRDIPGVESISASTSPQALAWLMDQARLRTPSKEIPGDDAFGGMIGRTPLMQALFGSIRRVAPLEVGVLVHGESGTGKELVALALHTLSGRRGKFIAVNCGAVAPELLGSQLFGHERGSFTGAMQSHSGCFEQAQGGTLFLDEITEMPPPLQVYLLRVIETHCLTRIGGSREIAVDVRIVAASNRDLARAVAAGNLRQDLYFRLLEFPLAVPPLRERREDIPLLVQHFLGLLNARYGTRKHIDECALRQLGVRGWPGNVRELRYVVQRLYIQSGDADVIDAVPEPEQRLNRRVSDAQPGAGGIAADPAVRADAGEGSGSIRFDVGMTLDHVERAVLLQTLAHCRNDKRAAARILGVSVKTIYNKLLRYRSEGLVGEAVLRESPEDSGRAA